MRIYTTIDGDMVDDIAFKMYADETQVSFILINNPGLVNQSTPLPGGVKINLPDLPIKPIGNAILDVWG